jgi:hypothetical protein
MRSRTVTAACSVAALLTTAGPLPAATAATVATAGYVVVGQTAPTPAAGQECGQGSFYVQDTDAVVGPSYSTTSGVVTSWSVQGGIKAGQVQLKIAHEGPADSYTVTGSSAVRILATGTLSTFPSRITVVTGDRLALNLPLGGPASACVFAGQAGDSLRYVNGSNHPEPAVGAVVVTDAGAPALRLNVSVTIEPDLDGDGFGDDTQDSCPSRADRQGDCAPPQTTIKAPRSASTSGTRATVKVELTASEPGTTFVCVVDGGRAKSCRAALALRLRVGRHHLVVIATDGAGNSDPTPAVATIRVHHRG